MKGELRRIEIAVYSDRRYLPQGGHFDRPFMMGILMNTLWMFEHLLNKCIFRGGQ